MAKLQTSRWLSCSHVVAKGPVRETTTFLLVILPNIHRFKKKFTDRLGNKPLLIWLLPNPSHLKYVATQLTLIACYLTLMFHKVVWATYSSCGGIFNKHFTVNLLRNLAVKKFWKSDKIWQNYGHEFVASFLAHPVYLCCLHLFNVFLFFIFVVVKVTF